MADQLNKPENEEAPVNTRDFVGAVAQDQEYEERVVAVNRTSKVVKGGKNFSFNCAVGTFLFLFS